MQQLNSPDTQNLIQQFKTTRQNIFCHAVDLTEWNTELMSTLVFSVVSIHPLTTPHTHTPQDLRFVRVSGVTSQEAKRVLTPPAAPLKPSDTQRTFVLHMSSQLSSLLVLSVCISLFFLEEWYLTFLKHTFYQTSKGSGECPASYQYTKSQGFICQCWTLDDSPVCHRDLQLNQWQ